MLAVSHLVGDFALQTDWQAKHKHGGLGSDPESRRALFSHVATYTLAFLPALVWIGDELGAATAIGTAALIFFPHLIQDDGRLIAAWSRQVKHAEPGPGPLLVAVDQTFHIVTLLLISLLVGS